jgi:hypothetical protein
MGDRGSVNRPIASRPYNRAMPKRSYGTGHVYEKSGSYYARWRPPDGRLLNRKIGPVRVAGETSGLTRAQAECQFRKMQEADSSRPVRFSGRPPHRWGDGELAA